jgi:predicted acetyltransferase
MELVFPSEAYKESYIEAVREFQADNSFPLKKKLYDKISALELEACFEKYVDRILGKARGENLPEGWVPATTYWLVDNGEYMGKVNIRHRLTESLEKIGGHIGYDIRPSKRGRGYGSQVLKLALPKAREIGITRALLTCDATNTASRKIIEKNGGVFENSVPNTETGVDKLHFWLQV